MYKEKKVTYNLSGKDIIEIIEASLIHTFTDEIDISKLRVTGSLALHNTTENVLQFTYPIPK